MNDIKTKKTGDCCFVSLQIMQDWRTSDDQVKNILNDKNIPDDSEPFLVHLYVTSGDKEFRHAVVQIDDWIVDLSNETSNVCHIDSYMHTHQAREPKLFDRDTVLAILYSCPDEPFWDYSEDDLLLIRTNAELLNSVWPPRIDFLKAFHDDIDPLSLIRFPQK